ncbi:hypothetical protein D3C84_951400 [compost metagenome]
MLGREVALEESLQRLLLGKGLDPLGVGVVGRRLQRFLHQRVLGFEVRIEAAVGQAQGLHQRLQAGGVDTFAAESAGRLGDDALMGFGFVVFGIAHGGRLVRSIDMAIVIPHCPGRERGNSAGDLSRRPVPAPFSPR